MQYILLMLFVASTPPSRLDHVDSVRFDNQAACLSAMAIVSKTAALAAQVGGFSTVPVSLECVPAAKA
ncbi:MAG TPA: hypothetical protein VMV19_04685 [Xanthobacteraceae bacterium]|nr:hypothetical protein [Xanthobacteraceae bacterium]